VKLSAHDAPVAAFPAFSDSDTINVVGLTLVADCSGALFWPTEGVLAVADLHLEKGSSLAARGVLLPPYDTATTLTRLGRLVASYSPRLVVAVGDSFHDLQGPTRISPRDRAALKALQRGREWVWIAGNHDPDPAEDIGGVFTDAFSLGPLTFRHDPTARYQTEWTLELGYDNSTAEAQTSLSCSPVAADGEIAGHLHPTARISQRGRSITRRCFATDGRRLVMPAFGAFTGGLNIRDAAFANVFGSLDFTAHLLGERRIYTLAAARCLSD
jgi:DNA ligase-associated metallophosphoesterase